MSEKKKYKLKKKSVIIASLIIFAVIGIINMIYLLFKKEETPLLLSSDFVDESENEYNNINGINGDRLVIDSLSGNSFFPAFQDVPKNTYDKDNFVVRNGYSFYKEGGEITSELGIDVSEFQGEIDWNAVKQAGIDFAVIRIGYRTYGTGEIVIDSRFGENLRNAEEAGIKTGVYFFSQAISKEEAVEEADTVIELISGYNITYPVVFDWELVGTDKARTDSTTVSDLADYCIAFSERVKSAGYIPMIYQNKNTAERSLDLTRLKNYDFWLAEYDYTPSYDYEFTMWQYYEKGVVPGIETTVDMNLSFVHYGETENISESEE